MLMDLIPRYESASEQMRKSGPSPRLKVVDTGNGIGWAVKEMWNGNAVRRRGWNGKGMYLKIQVPDSNSDNTLPYVWIRTVQGGRVPWICSQTDLLALDWEEAA